MFSPVAGSRAAEAIVQQLSAAILTGELAPGERLPPEVDLANAFGVAPMTLRQALVTLRGFDYVDTRRGRNGGTYVREDIVERLAAQARGYEASRDEIRDLTDWRRAVSGEASTLAAERGSAADFAALTAAAESYRQNFDIVSERRAADVRLHVLIAEIAGSPRLTVAEREIQEQLTRLGVSAIVPEIARDGVLHSHDELVAAITAGDAALARAEAIRHVEETYDWLIAMIGRRGEA